MGFFSFRALDQPSPESRLGLHLGGKSHRITSLSLMLLADIVLRRGVDLFKVMRPHDEFALLFGDRQPTTMIDLNRESFGHLLMFCFRVFFFLS